MNRRYSSDLSFVDLAFNLLICFVCLFSITFMLMSKKIEKDKKINTKAEFIITVIWDKNSNCDVDTYVEDPMGNLVSFGRREQGLMHLDRDDLGKRNDRVILQDGRLIEISENREIVTIRGIIPGEYVVNVHMYRRPSQQDYNPDTDGEILDEPNPTPVTIRLDKLNPRVKLIAQKEVTLENNGDEKTAFRFTLDKDGDVTSTTDLFKSLTKSLGSSIGDNYEYNNEEGN